MHLKRFTDPVKFYDHIAPALTQHEAENNLIFGLTNDAINGRYDINTVYMACVEQEGEVVLVVLRTGTFRVQLSYMPPQFDYLRLHALESVVNDLVATYGPDIAGVQGVSPVVKDFLSVWEGRTQQTYALHMAQRIYKLETVIPVRGVEGAVRYANDEDYDLMVTWFDDFNLEAIGSASDRERAQKVVDSYYGVDQTERGLMVWAVDDKPVSLAAYKGPTPHGMRVGPVYTPQELRGRGYASACTAALSQQVLDMGRTFCFLFTDLANPTSNRIYQAIGYEAVCDNDAYEIIPVETEEPSA